MNGISHVVTSIFASLVVARVAAFGARLARNSNTTLLAIPFVAVVVGGCRPPEGTAELVSTRRGAVTACTCSATPTSVFSCAGCPITVSLPIPQGLAPQDVAIASTGTLRINDRVVVTRPDGSLAAVSNIGTGEVNLGVEAKVGQIWSTSPVTLRNYSVTSGTLAGTQGISMQAGAAVRGFSAPLLAALPSRATTITATFPAGGTALSVEPNQQKTAVPGVYAAVTVKGGGTLRLASGTYYFDSLSVEPTGRISASVTGGAVTVYVARGFAFKGAVEEVPASSAETKLMLVALSTADVFVESSFSGALLVPNAKLTLATVAAGHRGTFFARSIETHQGTRIVHLPFVFPPPRASGALLAELRALDRRLGDATIAVAQADENALSREVDFIVHPSAAASAASDVAHAARTTARSAAVAVAGERDALVSRAVSQSSLQSNSYIESVLVVFLPDFRRALGLWAPGARFNSTCKELAQDQLLFDIVSAILRDDLPGYAVALSEIEKALQCSSLNDARLYAEALARALEQSVARFPVTARATVETVLVAALANVMILVHDDTKIDGPTRLFDWMSAHLTSMRDVFLDNASLVRRAGLWLRYPSGATLLQVKNLCEENPVSGCVSGELLVYGLLDPWRLGSGVCTALEMVSAPFDGSLGYVCDRGVCGEQPDANSAFLPATSGPVMARSNAANGLTPFGIQMTSLQNKLCSRLRQGGSSGVGQGWDRLMNCGIMAGRPERAGPRPGTNPRNP